MPESHNVEFSHKLTEQENGSGEQDTWEKVIEIARVIVLAVIAIATAWSGYQAAKWDGRQPPGRSFSMVVAVGWF